MDHEDITLSEIKREKQCITPFYVQSKNIKIEKQKIVVMKGCEGGGMGEVLYKVHTCNQ